MKQNNLLTKTLLLLAMIVGSINASWATDTYMLYYGANKAVDGNNLNSSDFKFFGATSTTGASAVEIGGNSYTHYLKLSKYTASIATDSARVVAYDAKTTQTKITAYVKNGDSNARDFYIGTIIEGETSEVTTPNTRKKTTNVSASGVAKIEFSITNSKNTLIGLYGGGKEKWEIYQVVVEETGDPLLQGGEDGYALNFPGRVCVVGKNNANTTSTVVDGMEILGSSSLSYLAGPLKLKQTTSYIKFTLNEKTLVSVTPNNTRKYIFSSANTPAGSETKYGGTSSTTVKTALAAGTWYLESENGSEFQLKDISFSIPIVTYNANGGSGSMGTTKFTVAANGFTAPTGQEFQEWNTESDGTGDSYAAGDEVESNTDLYAIWYTPAVKHHVTYDLNGGSGTTPTQDDVEEGQTFEVASGTTGITPPDGKIFSTWNDGTTDYAPGSTYTMSTSDVILYAQWLLSNNATFSNGSYTIGETILDLSTLFANGNGESVTYTVKNANGTGATIAGTSFTATTAGTATITATQGASASTAGAVLDATITVNNNPQGSHNLVWTLNTNKSESSVGTKSKSSSSTYLPKANMSNLTNNGSLTITNSTKSGYTVKIDTPKSYDADKYMSVSFDVSSGYKFIPTEVSVNVQPVTTKKDVKLVLTDGVNSIEKTQTNLTAGTGTDVTLDNADSKVFSGTVTLKIYCYGADDDYRLGPTIGIDGIVGQSTTVALAAACTDGAEYFGTYSNSKAFVVPADLTVSAIKLNASKKMELMKYSTGDIVAPNTGVLVSSTTSGAHTILLTVDEGTIKDGNLLLPSGDTGISAASMDVDGYYFYRLTMDNGQPGFWWKSAEGAGFDLGANKAYLKVSKGDATAQGFWFDDETTGIANVNRKQQFSGEYYNLNGQKVAQPTKGLYIVNGKKVVIK